jgi:transmembrane sensor
MLRLNTKSVVEVRMTHRRREVTLRSGEAVFDVAKDASRPFVVSAGDGTVTAVGTQFQVRNDAGAVAVTLMEGRVQVARALRREVESLDPGQQATFADNASGIVTRNVDVGALTSWMSGRLEFRGTPLEQAVAEANRYSTRKLRIGDPGIRALAVSGTFRTGDVDGIATAFEAAFDVRVESTGSEVVLYGR